jgi:hypothetical protein
MISSQLPLRAWARPTLKPSSDPCLLLFSEIVSMPDPTPTHDLISDSPAVLVLPARALPSSEPVIELLPCGATPDMEVEVEVVAEVDDALVPVLGAVGNGGRTWCVLPNLADFGGSGIGGGFELEPLALRTRVARSGEEAVAADLNIERRLGTGEAVLAAAATSAVNWVISTVRAMRTMCTTLKSKGADTFDDQRGERRGIWEKGLEQECLRATETFAAARG